MFRKLKKERKKKSRYLFSKTSDPQLALSVFFFRHANPFIDNWPISKRPKDSWIKGDREKEKKICLNSPGSEIGKLES